MTYIIGGAKEYWGADFSKERIDETIRRFFSKSKDQNTERDRRRIRTICDHVLFPTTRELETTSWLFGRLTEDLIRHETGRDQLESALFDIIRRVHSNLSVPDDAPDFESLNLNFRTPWDAYLRGLTPDLPTYLSDWLHQLTLVAKAQAFWLALYDAADQREIQKILAWYREAASRLGIETQSLSFPPWLEA